MNNKKGMTDSRGGAHRSVRTPKFMEEISNTVEADRRIEIAKFALMFDCGVATVHRVLHKDLILVKKSARRVPQLLNSDQKKERLFCSQAIKELVDKRITTIDAIMVPLYTTETKRFLKALNLKRPELAAHNSWFIQVSGNFVEKYPFIFWLQFKGVFWGYFTFPVFDWNLPRLIR